MSNFVLPLQEWLVHSALAGGLILLAGVVGMIFIRQPARRQRLGELALLASLLAAVLCALPAWLPYSVPIYPAKPQPLETPPPGVDEDALAANLDTIGSEDQASAVVPHEFLFTAAILEPLTESTTEAGDGLSMAAAASPASPPRHGALAWLATLYLLVVVALLTRFVIGLMGLWRLKRCSQPAPARAAALFAELTQGWQHPPQLRVCRRLTLPISFGVWRPVVLVPPWFCRRGAEEKLRWILVHELTHLERCDAWGCVLASLAQALYFYQPWFWWLRRQVRLCQEYVADAAAASLTSSADYAEYLVSLSSHAPQPLPAGAGVTGVLGSPSDLFRRIAMLLHPSRAVEKRCPRWWSLTAGIAFTAVAVLISGLSLHADEPKKEKRIVVETKPGELKDNIILRTVPGDFKGEITIEAAPGDKKGDFIIRAVPGAGAKGEFVIQAAPDGKSKEFKVLRVIAGDEKGKKDEKDKKGEKKEVERKVIVVDKDTPPEKVKALIKDAQGDAKTVIVEAVIDDGKVVELDKALKGGIAVLQEKGLELDKLREALKKAQEAAGAKGLEEVRKQLEEAMKRVEEAHRRADTQGKEAHERALKAHAEALKKLEGLKLDTKRFEGFKVDPKAFELKFDPKQFEALGGKKGFQLAFPGGGRLGAMVSTPSEDLLAQLDLGKDQGLVISAVTPDSAADKAGLKAHDLLLEFNGQAVSSNPAAFIRELNEIKADASVDAVVLRKGKKTNIKGIKLGEKTTGKFFEFKPFEGKDLVIPNPPTPPSFPKPAVPVIKEIPHVGKLFVEGAGKGSVMTSIMRENERFTTRYQEGSLIITITGTVEDDKAKVSSIVVSDGGKETKFEDVRKVPEQYRDKVKSLIEMSEKGQVKVEVRSGSVKEKD